MTPENLYPPYHIEFAEMDENPVPAHQHNFFELVYIINGNGKQIINGNTFDYEPGQMFLITPQDQHSFEVESTTQFMFLQFNDVYIKGQPQATIHDKERIKRLEFILHNASHQPGCILCNKGDKVLVKALVQSIGTESINRNIYHKEMIDQLVNTMITIVARNIALTLPENVDDHTDPFAMKLINYIQENIYSPEDLRANVMSNKLGISQGYLGRYFKKHVGEGIQQYITNYKLRLIETRLSHSNMRINEIVSELGFTDESHLNRVFKKYKGMSPTEFRKSVIAR